MHITGSKKKILIALAVKGFMRINPYRAQYVGEALAPASLKGREIRVNLTHHNAWQLRSATSADEVNRLAAKLGYQSISSFEAEVSGWFESMRAFGSIVVFQGCIQDDDAHDLWGAWAADSVGVVPANDAISGYAKLQVKTGAGNSVRVIADFLYPDRACKISTLDEYFSFFQRNLIPEIDGFENNANCLFRIKSKDSDKSVIFWAYSSREERSFIDENGRERSFNIPGSLEKTWNESVVQGLQSAGLCRVIAVALGAELPLERANHVRLARDIAQGLASGDVYIEAVPGQRHRVIGDALRGVGVKGSRMSLTLSKCFIGRSPKDIGFYPMVAIVNKTIPSSAKYVKDQRGSIVINRVFHEDDFEAVDAAGVVVNV